MGEREIARYYTLSDKDLQLIRRHRRHHNRLGFSIQLCHLRFPGWPLKSGEAPSSQLLLYVAKQLGVSPELLHDYSRNRDTTRGEHLLELQRDFGFQPCTESLASQLTNSLLPDALRSPKPVPLIAGLLNRMRTQKIIVPAMVNSYSSVYLWVYRNGIPPDKPCEVALRFVSPNYFDLMGIPVVAGRRFDSQDRLESPRVMVVSRQAVRTCWQSGDPINSQVQLGGNKPTGANHQVVGVVGDVRDKGIDEGPVAVGYQLLEQNPRNDYALIVHANSDPAGLVPSIRQAVLEIDAGPKPTRFEEVRTLDSLVRDSAWRLNYSTMMLGALAGLSLVLAAVGVYGVLSQAVRQRSREIGLRMALGADRFQVQRMILRQGLTPVLVGVAIGTLAAAGVTRFLGSLLFGVDPLDLPTFGVTVVVLLATALLASYIPARRAVKVDPASALRCE